MPPPMWKIPAISRATRSAVRLRRIRCVGRRCGMILDDPDRIALRRQTQHQLHEIPSGREPPARPDTPKSDD